MSDNVSNNPVTGKALVIGAICAALIAIGEPYGVLIIHGSALAADFSTGGAIFVFFFVTLLLNPILRFLHPRLHLTEGELLTVYAMMLVASALPSWGFTMNLLPLIAGFSYYATPENDWKGLILPHLPSWAMPTDHEAIRQFFEGATGGRSVPWAAWARPLLAWGIFIFAVYLAMICLMVIVRKRWMEEEKLVYPLAQLPIEMVRKESDTPFPQLFKRPIFWVGAVIPAGVNTINALHTIYPFIIEVPVRGYFTAFSREAYVFVQVWFEVIGLSYLLNLDIAFSLWFFALFAVIERGIFDRIGWSIGPIQPFSSPAPPNVAHQGLGALIVIVAAGLWAGRRHLKMIFRRAVGQEEDVPDEILSPRWAVIGLIGGLTVATVWLVLAGLQVPYAILAIVSAFVIFLGLTRAVAEGGLAYGRAPVNAPVFVVNAVGSWVKGYRR